MTDDRIALRGLLEKSADADLLREMIGFAAERLMELEVQALTGAGYGERAPDRLAQRNGGPRPRGAPGRPPEVAPGSQPRVSVAATIAVAVNSDGRREAAGKPGRTLVVGPFPDSGMAIGGCEAETFWIEFLRQRGLAGVKLVISDAPEGIKAAVARGFRAPLRADLRGRRWEPSRLAALPGCTSCATRSLMPAGAPARRVGVHRHRLRPGPCRRCQGAVAPGRRPGVRQTAQARALLAEAEADVLAYMAFPKEHRAKLHSTNPLERVNGEIKRRTEVLGIFPNEAAITRLVGAIRLEQNAEWAVPRARYLTLETIAPLRDDLTLMLPAAAA